MMFTEPEKAENVTQWNLGVVQLCELKTGMIAKSKPHLWDVVYDILKAFSRCIIRRVIRRRRGEVSPAVFQNS